MIIMAVVLASVASISLLWGMIAGSEVIIAIAIYLAIAAGMAIAVRVVWEQARKGSGVGRVG